jgi:dTDP-4-dehydrorhamnose reductase
VYVSTDYVFDGTKRSPYVESDAANPLNAYGSSKLAGEAFTLGECRRSVVVRVSGLYGATPCRAKGENFVTKMLRAAREQAEVRVVTDEVLTPTPASLVAHVTATLVERGEGGLFHLTCEGECSWYEFARAIFDAAGIATPLVAARVADFPSKARRPAYSVLENARLKSLGTPALPHWREALNEFLQVARRRE